MKIKYLLKLKNKETVKYKPFFHAEHSDWNGNCHPVSSQDNQHASAILFTYILHFG